MEIATDEYVRSIDLSFNRIPQGPLKTALVEGLKVNESIVNIKLEENVGYTTNVKRQIALCILKNMEIYKAKGQAIKPHWIDMKQIDILDDQINDFA